MAPGYLSESYRPLGIGPARLPRSRHLPVASSGGKSTANSIHYSVPKTDLKWLRRLTREPHLFLGPERVAIVRLTMPTAVSSLVPWPPSRSPIATAVALTTALLGPPALAVLSRMVYGPSPPLSIQVPLQLVLCMMAILVLLIVLRSEQLPLASIGVRRPDLMTGVLAVILMLVAYYLLPLLTTPLLRTLGLGGFEPGLETIGHQPRWWRVCVALTSGPVEEVLYRGYAVERFGTLTGRLPLGGAFAAVAFGLVHTPFWGLGPALAANLPFGVLMVSAYIWRRDLCATTIAHTGLLLIGLLSV